MNWPALILAVLAVVVLVCCHLGVQRRWATTNAGLALAVTAWIVQSVFVGLHQVTLH
jgi:uncharacterized membrane protein YGL010W